MEGVITAARLEIALVGGPSNLNYVVGLAQRLEMNDAFNYIPLKGIGFRSVVGYEPGVYEGRGSLSTILLLKQNLAKVGIDDHKAFVFQTAANGFDLIARDKQGNEIDHLREVRIDSSRKSVDVGQQIVMTDVQIVFLRDLPDGF